MKTIALILACLLPTALLKGEDGSTTPWVVVDKPLPEFVEAYDGKNVMVFYTAAWCVTCELMKKHLQSDEFRQLLKRKNLIVCLVDCTTRDSVGAKEMERGGYHTHTVPALSMIHKDGMTTYAPLDLGSKEIFFRTVSSLIGKAEPQK